MTLLVLGIIFFFGVHLLPSTPVRTMIVARTGEGGYKGLFSLVSLTGLGLIIYGFSLAEFVPLFDPLSFGRTLTYWVMPVAIILICAADAPNNIKRVVRHPMLIGITLWSACHLAANGDLASTLLFASFGVFSVLDIALIEAGGRFKTKEPASIKWDIGIVIVGIGLYFALMYFHGSFTGMPLM